tara:strand:- start:1308 stop:2150 length:843 start_codon:yes stop_codon:yes gene_type:complete
MKVSLEFNPNIKYLENGNNILNNILNNNLYYLSNQEKDIIKQNIDNILYFSHNSDIINIIDLGSSDGLKTYPIIIKALEKYNKVCYIPIDTSQKSIESCKKKYLELKSDKFKIIPIIGDYDDLLNIKINKKQNNLILFLGSTLGNYEQYIVKDLLNKYVLKNCKFICTFDSIPNSKKNIEDIINAYNISEMIDLDMNMLNIIKKKNKYLRNEDFERFIEYDNKNNVLVRWFESNNYKFRIEVSYKYSLDSIIKLIKNENIFIKNYWTINNSYMMFEFKQL